MRLALALAQLYFQFLTVLLVNRLNMRNSSCKSRGHRLFSPLDVLMVVALIVGASGVVQGIPYGGSMGVVDYARILTGFGLIGVDLYLVAKRLPKKRR
jgi:hypothetical protein